MVSIGEHTFRVAVEGGGSMHGVVSFCAKVRLGVQRGTFRQRNCRVCSSTLHGVI